MTHQDDRRIDRALLSASEEGRACVLATVVATKGSTPRKVGARLVVDRERGLAGSVGGGCGEAEVIAVAERVLESGEPERITVDLTEDLLSWSPAVCGGTMDVFVERVPVSLEELDAAHPTVRIDYRRPPDRLQTFDQQLVYRDETVAVTLARRTGIETPMRLDGEVVLEPGSPVVWFTFRDAWHDIGRFHRADGTFTGVYANVLTPVEIQSNVWDTTDLFLDVWIPVDGGPRLLDEEEFDEALAKKWLDMEVVDRARHEANRIMEAAGGGSWPPKVVELWTLERCLEELGAAADDDGPPTAL